MGALLACLKCSDSDKRPLDVEDLEAAVFEPRPEPVSDLLVNAAAEFVLAAASMAPVDCETVTLARRRFTAAYRALVNGDRFPNDNDGEAYFTARCVLNAHRANVKFVDAPVSELCDGIYKPFNELHARRPTIKSAPL